MAKKSSASILKSKGLIPKKWDLRSLTDYKKRIIRKREKEYPEVIKHPYKFQGRKYSKDKAKALLNAGYSGVGQHILIPNRGNSTTSTRVLRDKIVIDRGDRIETVYLSSGPNFLKNLYKRIDAPLPRGSFWALKVGDNNTFLNNYTKTLSQLMRYGESVQFTNPDAKNYVHLVRIDYKNGLDSMQMPYNPNNPTEPSKKMLKKWRNKRGK